MVGNILTAAVEWSFNPFPYTAQFFLNLFSFLLANCLDISKYNDTPNNWSWRKLIVPSILDLIGRSRHQSTIQTKTFLLLERVYSLEVNVRIVTYHEHEGLRTIPSCFVSEHTSFKNRRLKSILRGFQIRFDCIKGTISR